VVGNGLLRQNSKTGSLTKCNEEKIALFRHGDNVYGINEKCPHAGNVDIFKRIPYSEYWGMV
jgi:nitrite reductase/ring-hydroxylating ferredoxin subunit